MNPPCVVQVATFTFTFAKFSSETQLHDTASHVDQRRFVTTHVEEARERKRGGGGGGDRTGIQTYAGDRILQCVLVRTIGRKRERGDGHVIAREVVSARRPKWLSIRRTRERIFFRGAYLQKSSRFQAGFAVKRLFKHRRAARSRARNPARNSTRANLTRGYRKYEK